MSDEGITLRDFFETRVGYLDKRFEEMRRERSVQHKENAALLRALELRLVRLEHAMWLVAGGVMAAAAVYDAVGGHLLRLWLR